MAIGCGVYERVRVNHRPSNPPLAALNLSFAYSAIGFALSLLLVFKTNTAYARYWEGVSSVCGNVHAPTAVHLHVTTRT